MPGLVEALQMTEILSEPQGPSIHHILLAGPDQISSVAFYACVDRTGSQVALRTSFPSLTLITLPSSPLQQNEPGEWGEFKEEFVEEG